MIRTILLLLLSFQAGFCREVFVASWPVIEAEIFLDGRLVGSTPTRLELKAGRYKLLAKKEGWVGEEREVVIEEGETSPIFINLLMRMTVAEEPLEVEKPKELAEGVLLKKEEAKREEIKKAEEVEKIEAAEVEKKEAEPKAEEKKEEQFAEIVVGVKEEPPGPKKEDEYPIWKLILKVESIIEEAEEEGARRYAPKTLSLAKKTLNRAKKENSYEKVELSLQEAERALKETLEKRRKYESGYLLELIKSFGK